ncbi:MAG: hypothetical protein LBH43_05800 [Treponema sp.]|jgi:flagellar biosynthesis/type III secretory pathway protein FliH|nr:hypothetical protein [Treponema sp.]
MKYITVLVVIAFLVGYYFGGSNAEEKIVYQPRVEYVNDPNSVTKAAMETEVSNARRTGYEEGRRAGIGEGYNSGYIQGTEYGKSLILAEIDLRVQEAERTNRNIPLFVVRE